MSNESKHWWQSTTIVPQVLALIGAASVLLGIEISDAKTAAIGVLLTSAISIIGRIVATKTIRFGDE